MTSFTPAFNSHEALLQPRSDKVCYSWPWRDWLHEANKVFTATKCFTAASQEATSFLTMRCQALLQPWSDKLYYRQHRNGETMLQPRLKATRFFTAMKGQAEAYVVSDGMQQWLLNECKHARAEVVNLASYTARTHWGVGSSSVQLQLSLQVAIYTLLVWLMEALRKYPNHSNNPTMQPLIKSLTFITLKWWQ